MCGRYCAPDGAVIRPGDTSLVRTALENEPMRWGIPLQNRRLIINARCETAASKPLFRHAMQSGRAIIEASAFFEWDDSKRCHTFTAQDRQTIYLAALFIPASDGSRRFSVLTQPAQGKAQTVHPRMPCFLPSAEYRHLWLHSDALAPALLRETQPLHIEFLPRDREQLSLLKQ